MVNVSVSRDTPQRHVIQDRTSLFISSSFAPAVTAPRLAIKIKPGTHASSKCICFDGSLNCPVFSLFQLHQQCSISFNYGAKQCFHQTLAIRALFHLIFMTLPVQPCDRFVYHRYLRQMENLLPISISQSVGNWQHAGMQPIF